MLQHVKHNCVRIFSSASRFCCKDFWGHLWAGSFFLSSFFLPFILFPLSFLPERCHTDPFRSTVFSPALFCRHAAHIPHLQCNYCDFVCKHEKPSVPHPAVAPLSFLFFLFFIIPLCAEDTGCVFTHQGEQWSQLLYGLFTCGYVSSDSFVPAAVSGCHGNRAHTPWRRQQIRWDVMLLVSQICFTIVPVIVSPAVQDKAVWEARPLMVTLITRISRSSAEFRIKDSRDSSRTQSSISVLYIACSVT